MLTSFQKSSAYGLKKRKRILQKKNPYKGAENEDIIVRIIVKYAYAFGL